MSEIRMKMIAARIPKVPTRAIILLKFKTRPSTISVNKAMLEAKRSGKNRIYLVGESQNHRADAPQ